jgi:hypothetical protein
LPILQNQCTTTEPTQATATTSNRINPHEKREEVKEKKRREGEYSIMKRIICKTKAVTPTRPAGLHKYGVGGVSCVRAAEKISGI